MTPAENMIEAICNRRFEMSGTPAHLTRARLSLKVGVNLNDREELKRVTAIEDKITHAAAALGITL